MNLQSTLLVEWLKHIACFLQVIVLESSSRFGGWLWSTRRSDGAVFEHGPRGIRPAGAVGYNTLNMVSSTVVTHNAQWCVN